MTVEYFIDVAADKRDALIDSLKDLNVWVMENNADDDLWMQGHPGVHADLVKTHVPFTMIESGSVWDLHVEVGANGGEVLNVHNHETDEWYYDISVDKYNEVYDNMCNDEYEYDS